MACRSVWQWTRTGNLANCSYTVVTPVFIVSLQPYTYVCMCKNRINKNGKFYVTIDFVTLISNKFLWHYHYGY